MIDLTRPLCWQARENIPEIGVGGPIYSGLMQFFRKRLADTPC
ncbi:Unknown protein sequence [Pseudomonas syringae pv. maculicola]|nr:Unknown protein sequence [Pseudomonas syringae pv. maculicola]